MEIRPIKTKADHKRALVEIERLFDAKPGTPEEDRLNVLGMLVDAYEEAHCPILPPDPIAAIEYWIETRGLTQRDLEPCIGSRARVNEILNRKRALTLDMIRKLQSRLGIPAEFLIQPYELTTNVA